MSFLAAAGWTLAAVLLYALGLSIAEGMRAGAVGDVVTRATCGALAYSLTLFIILRIHEPEGSIRKVLALKMPPVLTIPLAVVAGAGLAGPAAWLDKVLLARFTYSDQEKELMEKLVGESSYDTTGKRVAMLLIGVLVMPILDELFFRGALFTPLRKRARLEPVLMATAAYETLSSSPHVRDMLSLLALSLALSWIRGLTGSSIPSMLARIAFFAPDIVPKALGKDLPPLSKGMLAGSLGAAVLSLLMIAMLSRGRALDEQVSDT
jgi:membrane protease YdiL (CAAX protease family)